ncbi:hypothetical protein IOCL2690_000807200 [Leishmania lindenbergi]|uniref:Uncharacterized protein n=1 Tax=Leishmania lindenbergi TaxID=651832 RepID=A0AAW2ZRW1_9TRYP
MCQCVTCRHRRPAARLTLFMIGLGIVPLGLWEEKAHVLLNESVMHPATPNVPGSPPPEESGNDVATEAHLTVAVDRLATLQTLK